MVGFDYLLAVVLLTAPPETSAKIAPELYGTVRAPLRTVAIQCEIMDRRETYYMLTRPEEFPADVHLLRSRYQELLDAPSVKDSLRFPDRTIIQGLMDFNRSYRENVVSRRSMTLGAGETYDAALHETDQLYEVWDALNDARCDYYYVVYRRQALKKLRKLVGEDAYYSGRLPPPVPLWRFEEID